MKLKPDDKKVLDYLVSLDDGYAAYFATIARKKKLTIPVVRRSCRKLKRNGYTELVVGLINEEDGGLAGSGYSATHAGRDLIITIQEEKERAAAMEKTRLFK